MTGKLCAMPMLKLNSRVYLPLVLRDIATVEYLCTPEVRAERRRFLSFHKLGFGWNQEQGNKVLKRLVHGGGEAIQWEIAQMLRA